MDPATALVSRAQASKGSAHGSEWETVEPFPGNHVDFLKTCLCSNSPASVPESDLLYFLGWFPGDTRSHTAWSVDNPWSSCCRFTGMDIKIRL